MQEPKKKKQNPTVLMFIFLLSDVCKSSTNLNESEGTMESTQFIWVLMFFLCILSQKQIQRNSTADLEIKCFMQG